MGRSARITTLVENTAWGFGMLGEHGLAFRVDVGSHSVLFDTGQSDVLVGNSEKLGVDLKTIEAIVLSHGHYDHTGGLDSALRTIGSTKVYAHKAAFSPKYARLDDGRSREIGMSFISEKEIRRRTEALIRTERPAEVFPGLFVTGEIPRITGFEDTGGPFYLDKQCCEPDPLMDDQAMFFSCSRGTVVILGCAHAGVINTLEYIRTLTGGAPVYAVLGGMHLAAASEQRIERTIEEFGKFNPEILAPAHCTGMEAVAGLWAAFPGKCCTCAVGFSMEFED